MRRWTIRRPIRNRRKLMRTAADACGSAATSASSACCSAWPWWPCYRTRAAPVSDCYSDLSPIHHHHHHHHHCNIITEIITSCYEGGREKKAERGVAYLVLSSGDWSTALRSRAVAIRQVLHLLRCCNKCCCCSINHPHKTRGQQR